MSVRPQSNIPSRLQYSTMVQFTVYRHPLGSSSCVCKPVKLRCGRFTLRLQLLELNFICGSRLQRQHVWILGKMIMNAQFCPHFKEMAVGTFIASGWMLSCKYKSAGQHLFTLWNTEYWSLLQGAESALLVSALKLVQTLMLPAN